MCGICGFIDYRNPINTRKELVYKMCDLLIHRGPDEFGYYFNENVGLGHRRLSIIDLSSGQQPMKNIRNDIWIVFNGEIYNFPELKEELLAKGFVFNTNSDTEVIINGYDCYGVNILNKLNGMFVFAIWDEKKKRLFAARDRLGKKPFYYYAGSDQFVFASELKSLLVVPDIARNINPEAIDKYFSFGYIPAPMTIIDNIYKLRPGHFLLWENETVSTHQYWDVEYKESQLCKTEDDYVDYLDELLAAAVKRRLISDVPLGAFLSGGIDSSTVVGMMARASSNPVKTFTIGFEEQIYSEIEDARIVANSFSTDHHEYKVKSNAIDILPKLVWHFDEPFADSSAVPTFYVSKIARENVTVILSGDGGDELFAGYRSYHKRNQYEAFKKLPRSFRNKLIGPIARKLPINAKGKYFLLELSQLEKSENFKIIEIYPQIKQDLYSTDFNHQLEEYDGFEALVDYWKNMPVSPKLSRMQYFDTKFYLPEDILVKVDRMSMANSLETRAPLLDYKVVEFAATIPAELQFKDGSGKYILRKMASRFLPGHVFTKPKQGFAIPMKEWFQNELKGYALDMLTSARFSNRGYFKDKNINFILNEHLKGHRDYSMWIWSLLIFELWHQTYLDMDLRNI